MKTGRYVLAGAVLFGFAIVWNAFVHLLVLAPVDASVAHLRRPDFADKLWLSLVLTAGIVALFVAGYARVARTGSQREGALYGVFFACLAGLLVDLNQYLLYPIPAHVAGLWFLAGLAEFTGYGVIVSRLCPPPHLKS
jgi:hypothetical protein